MKIFDYLRYSGLWFGVVVNPFHWQPDVQYVINDALNEIDYYDFYLYVSIGPIWVRITIDDGSW